MLLFASKIITALFIATKLYAHKKGSHNGMTPKRLFRRNVSTPVEVKKYSEISMMKNPKIKIKNSLFSYFIRNAIVMMNTYAVVRA